MEHDLVLEGRVVTPTGIEETEVGISDGVIARVGRGLKGARRVKTGRCLVFPGFIDIHVHLREPGWEHKEDFRTGTLAAIHGGVTTVVDMPNNPVPTTTSNALELKAALAGAKGKVDVRFNGGVIPKNLGQLSDLAALAVGFKLYMSETTGAAGFPRTNLPEAFRAVAATGNPLSIHCEDQEIIDRRRAELAGDSGPGSYADLRPPAAEASAVSAVIDAMRPVPTLRANVCHASTRESLGLVRSAREAKMKLRCEATLHHVFYNRGELSVNPLLRTNPPLRSEEDRAALIGGLADGTVSFLVTDHAPHTREEKVEKGLAGVPGLDDYAHLVCWLIRDVGFDPTLVARIASSNPARYMRLGDRGEVAVGKRADLTVLDVHSPEKVKAEQVLSKCGWSPFEGKEFPGKARWTMRGGEFLLDDFEVLR